MRRPVWLKGLPHPNPVVMNQIDQQNRVARGLADALITADNNKAAAKVRLTSALGREWRWLDALTIAVHRKFGVFAGPSLALLVEPLVQLIARQRGFVGAWDGRVRPPQMSAYFVAPRTMQARAYPCDQWTVPDLPTTTDLAGWLALSGSELDWFAGQNGFAQADAEALRHYRYQWISKRNGSLRLLEAPKSRLKSIQRQILKGILEFVPPHEAAHGFRARHSCLSHASLHAGKAMVLRMDLRDFFASVSAARVQAVFCALGYPQAVAWKLTGLCTHAGRRSHLIAAGTGLPLQWRALSPYTAPHLPQGAPSSPVLANLCSFKLDLRLAALADDADAAYSRYADDLTFSGDAAFARGALRLVDSITAVVVAEGFAINSVKTRLMHGAQRQTIVGLVVNTRPNVRRADFDRLKAVLHQCIRDGPETQNRDGVADFRAHLQGRVAHQAYVHPVRGAKLRTMFESIVWRSAGVT